ncbi:arginase [Xenophilus arseniciresistens]|uniref:Arginase n=1 Tax=Xenophilus arseniciresistens TaxID=1283306 RepID=A0AAE3ND62_9BURK|nr:arginase [Xenophilus arseniciresistens]MDA7418661.1 arginase [Xenophilus arseniciresistens]
MKHDMLPRPLALIGAEVGEGASDAGCKWGSQALRERGLAAHLRASGRAARWTGMVRAPAARHSAQRLRAVEHFSAALAQQVLGPARAGALPVVVGGDHSCAVGTWSAVAEHWRAQGDIGLVWIDAHLDAHTPATSLSGAPHGMPVAALLGHGSPGLALLQGWAGKLKPHNLVILGARSFEAGEQALLTRLGVRVMYMEEVARRGFGACFAEALALVQRHTVAWGLSFDLDALDPADAPGTGTPVAAGIALADALAALRGCAADPACAALELVEYNPLHDADGRTARAAFALLKAMTAPQGRGARPAPCAAAQACAELS